MKYISPSDAPAGGNMAISPLLKILKTKLIYLPETYRPNGDGIKLGKRGVYWCSSPHPADKEHSGLMFNFHPYTAMDFEYNIYNPVVTSTPASIR